MKASKAFFVTALALVFILTAAACTSRKDETPSSSEMPASSAMESSSMPSSSDDMMSDLESTASDMMSNVESAVTTAMSTDFDKIGALGSDQVLWGPGVLVDDKNRTTEPIFHQRDYGQYSAYFIGPEDCGKLYLTFDEGYENGFTPAILDVLKEKDVKAVFFVTMPFVKSSPDLVQRMIDEGHMIGNHTNHHWNPTKKSLADAEQDIRDLDDYMVENFNYKMTLYRPPEGAFSEQTLALAQQMGYSTLLWSFAYKDYDVNAQPDYDTAYARTTKFIHEGGIYLLHAVSKTNTEILGGLIDEIRARGLELSLFDLPYVPAEP